MEMSRFKARREQERENDSFPLYADIMGSTVLATQSCPACLEKRQHRGRRIETIKKSSVL